MTLFLKPYRIVMSSVHLRCVTAASTVYQRPKNFAKAFSEPKKFDIHLKPTLRLLEVRLRDTSKQRNQLGPHFEFEVKYTGRQ
jgi:hypothetical protein